MKRVLIVDDHPILRQGVALLMQSTNEFSVVGQASDGAEAVRLAGELSPDLVVMDVEMAGMSGAVATSEILKKSPEIKVLVLSCHRDEKNVSAMLRAGAKGYIFKNSATQELLDATQAVLKGEQYISPSVMAEVANTSPAGSSQPRRETLTPREQEVLRLLADGKAMKEAAVALNLSTKTIETHRRAIMEKLQLFSVAELTKHAVREGLTTLD